ncbi:DUF2207 domain-containing protein [bacterium]|nr:DUF2207 domain-containing protein [bacterium]
MRISFLVVALLLLIGTASAVDAREVIQSFSSRARLSPSGVMEVKETIEADIRGSRHKALYRIIDNSISHQGHLQSLDVKVKSVEDGRGRALKFTQSRQGTGVIVNLDKSHAGRAGKVRYVLTYEVKGAVNFKDNHPALVWDVTGENFPVLVQKASFNLKLPPGINPKAITVKAWKGEPVKGHETAAKSAKGEVIATASSVNPGESFKVEVDLPMGTVTEPGFLEAIQWIAGDWYLLVLLPLSAVIVLALVRFLKTGIKSRVDEASEIWQAPEGLRPVEIGTLVDQSCDVSDVSVTLINLAVRGYYTVREIPSTGFFALSDRDYEFKKLPPPKGDPLKEYEEIFMQAIFGNASTSYLSNIQGIFRQFLPDIRNSIYKSLVDRKMLAKDPGKDKKFYGAIGFALAICGVALLFLMGETDFLKAEGLGLVVAGILVSIAPAFIPLRTEKGKKAIDQIHLFAETMRTAKDRNLAEKLQEDRFLFHKLLPYAIILGVFEKWAAACEEYEELWPDWFQFYVDGPRENFSATRFAKDVWIATKVAGLTFTAPPPRQYSSHTVGKFGTRHEQEHDGLD